MKKKKTNQQTNKQTNKHYQYTPVSSTVCVSIQYNTGLHGHHRRPNILICTQANCYWSGTQTGPMRMPGRCNLQSWIHNLNWYAKGERGDSLPILFRWEAKYLRNVNIPYVSIVTYVFKAYLHLYCYALGDLSNCVHVTTFCCTCHSSLCSSI